MDLIDGPGLLKRFQQNVQTCQNRRGILGQRCGRTAGPRQDLPEYDDRMQSSTGGTKPGEIRTLIKAGVAARHSDTLHAKICLLVSRLSIGDQ